MSILCSTLSLYIYIFSYFIFKKKLDYCIHSNLLNENIKKQIDKNRASKMWHEARKQEKKLRGILVDHKKRAERRKTFYDKIVINKLTNPNFIHSNLASSNRLGKNPIIFHSISRKKIQLNFCKSGAANARSTSTRTSPAPPTTLQLCNITTSLNFE